MKRISALTFVYTRLLDKKWFLTFSLLFCSVISFAQSNNDTNISGDDVGWGDGYDLIYKVDGTVYKTISLEGASEQLFKK